MLGGDDGIGERSVIVRTIVVIERRNRQQYSRVKSVHPGKTRQRVGLVVAVAKRKARILPGQLAIDQIVLDVAGERIERNLVVVLAQRSHEAELVGGANVEDQRAEASIAVGGIVYDLRDGCLNAEIAAVAVHAGVVGEALGMAAEAELVVGLIEISGAENEFGLAVALESGARHHIEDAIGAVAKFSAIASAAHFKIVDVFGIELRSEVGGDVSVGHGDAVDQPTGLMSSANVKLIVGDVGAGHEVGDHRQAVGTIRAGSAGDLEAIDHRGWRSGIGGSRIGGAGDVDHLFGSRDIEREMQHGLRAGQHGHV